MNDLINNFEQLKKIIIKHTSRSDVWQNSSHHHFEFIKQVRSLGWTKSINEFLKIIEE